MLIDVDRLLTDGRSLKDAEVRVRWLEEVLDQHTGIYCHEIATGTPLPVNVRRDLPVPSTAEHNEHMVPTQVERDAGRDAAQDLDALNSPTRVEHSDMSLLALNATGEQRYLGPSSGSFFSSYATAILRSCAPGQTHIYSEQAGIWSNSKSLSTTNEGQLPIQPEMVALLQKSYEAWINPLYPLLSLERLNDLVSRSARSQEFQPTDLPRPSGKAGEMTLFYMIMALGAMNRARTLSLLQPDYISTNFPDGLASAPSPAFLYAQAMRSFQMLEHDLQPSLPMIQMLLLVCIYSSHSPLGPSQWQLAGFAMRVSSHDSGELQGNIYANTSQSAVEIGLHHSAKSWNAPDHADAHNRVFWTTYAIEITIAYNLGRPPSIGEEHITADLPLQSAETALALQHIEHRRIQGRIISHVYCGTPQFQRKTSDEQSALINSIQMELDAWRSTIGALCPPGDKSPYPHRYASCPDIHARQNANNRILLRCSYWDRLYHGTTFVLHRKSPLCPAPSGDSVERCIRAAGAYVDNVVDLLKHSDVPTSWMLVQGVLFAGLTMLVTARTSFMKIPRQKSLPLLMVDYPAWTRRCAVCLAIMNERWDNTLLPKLAAQFETLADSTLRIISTTLMSVPADITANGSRPNDARVPTNTVDEASNTSFAPPSTVLQEHASQFLETYDSFAELFGTNGATSFWDFSSQDVNMDANAQFGFFDMDTSLDFAPSNQVNNW